MQIGRYLREYQPIIYRTFVNSLESHHLSHAYLISGAPGTPLLDTAKYLAKSILCNDPSPLACNNCITCLRIDDDNYPDFIVYDGAKNTIKKDQVNTIESQFEKTAFESKGKMIYILHLVENMTIEAVNSILKFLEEPNSEIYAFLTTNNESIILPTIISRCQVLHLKLIDRKQVIDSAVEEGVDIKDAELLSYFYNDPELIKEILENEDKKEEFYNAKDAFEGLINELDKDDNKAAVNYVESTLSNMIKSKESARYFLDMLAQGFQDILRIRHGEIPILETYATILGNLNNKLPHVEESLLEILKDRNIINSNVNIPLLLDHMIFSIVKE